VGDNLIIVDDPTVFPSYCSCIVVIFRISATLVIVIVEEAGVILLVCVIPTLLIELVN